MKIFTVISVAILLPTLAGAAVISPEGDLRPYLGAPIFYTESISAQINGDILAVTIITNYPGPWQEIDYNIADLRIDRGPVSAAVKMSGPRPGRMLLMPTWNTSELFRPLPVDYGRHPDGSYIAVHATGGQIIGQARVNWHKQGDGSYRITIDIPAGPLQEWGLTGQLTISWGTAHCGNCYVATTAALAPVPHAGGTSGPTYHQPGPSRPAPGAGPRFPVWPMPWFFGPGFAGGDCPDNPVYINPIPPTPPIPPVPLPSSLLLLAGGLARLFFRRK